MGKNKRSIKLVIVGDAAIGKTCLLSTYAENIFPHEYVSTGRMLISILISPKESFEIDG